MSPVGLLVLMLIAFFAWFIPLLWVAFHDKGFPEPGASPPRPRIGVGRYTLMWLGIIVGVSLLVAVVRAIFPAAQR